MPGSRGRRLQGAGAGRRAGPLAQVLRPTHALPHRTPTSFVVNRGTRKGKGACPWAGGPGGRGTRPGASPVLAAAPDQVLDVQDGGGQLLLQALLWGHRQGSTHASSPLSPPNPRDAAGSGSCPPRDLPSGQNWGAHQTESLSKGTLLCTQKAGARRAEEPQGRGAGGAAGLSLPPQCSQGHRCRSCAAAHAREPQGSFSERASGRDAGPQLGQRKLLGAALTQRLGGCGAGLGAPSDRQPHVETGLALAPRWQAPGPALKCRGQNHWALSGDPIPKCPQTAVDGGGGASTQQCHSNRAANLHAVQQASQELGGGAAARRAPEGCLVWRRCRQAGPRGSSCASLPFLPYYCPLLSDCPGSLPSPTPLRGLGSCWRCHPPIRWWGGAGETETQQDTRGQSSGLLCGRRDARPRPRAGQRPLPTQAWHPGHSTPRRRQPVHHQRLGSAPVPTSPLRQSLRPNPEAGRRGHPEPPPRHRALTAARKPRRPQPQRPLCHRLWLQGARPARGPLGPREIRTGTRGALSCGQAHQAGPRRLLSRTLCPSLPPPLDEAAGIAGRTSEAQRAPHPPCDVPQRQDAPRNPQRKQCVGESGRPGTSFRKHPWLTPPECCTPGSSPHTQRPGFFLRGWSCGHPAWQTPSSTPRGKQVSASS